MPLITVVNSHFTYSVNCLWYELKFRFQDNDPFVSHFCFQPLIFYYCCGLQVTFLANRVKPPGLPVGCLCVCNGDLLWLNVQTDRAGFWFERYHRTQLLCVKWGVRIHRGEAELPDKSKKSETYAHQFVFFYFTAECEYNSDCCRPICFGTVGHMSTCCAIVCRYCSPI